MFSFSLYRKKGVNAYIYTINSIEGLILFSFLVYRYMRKDKISYLWKVIDWLNNQKKGNNAFHIPIKTKKKRKVLPTRDNEGTRKNCKQEWFMISVPSSIMRTYQDLVKIMHIFRTLSNYKIQCRMEIVQNILYYNKRLFKDLV